MRDNLSLPERLKMAVRAQPVDERLYRRIQDRIEGRRRLWRRFAFDLGCYLAPIAAAGWWIWHWRA